MRDRLSGQNKTIQSWHHHCPMGFHLIPQPNRLCDEAELSFSHLHSHPLSRLSSAYIHLPSMSSAYRHLMSMSSAYRHLLSIASVYIHLPSMSSAYIHVLFSSHLSPNYCDTTTLNHLSRFLSHLYSFSLSLSHINSFSLSPLLFRSPSLSVEVALTHSHTALMDWGSC